MFQNILFTSTPLQTSYNTPSGVHSQNSGAERQGLHQSNIRGYYKGTGAHRGTCCHSSIHHSSFKLTGKVLGNIHETIACYCVSLPLTGSLSLQSTIRSISTKLAFPSCCFARARPSVTVLTWLKCRDFDKPIISFQVAAPLLVHHTAVWNFTPSKKGLWKKESFTILQALHTDYITSKGNLSIALVQPGDARWCQVAVSKCEGLASNVAVMVLAPLRVKVSARKSSTTSVSCWYGVEPLRSTQTLILSYSS